MSTIKVDIDKGTGLSRRLLSRRLKIAGYTLKRITRMVSGSGRGVHIIITVEPAPSSPMEVVALQLICGSDPTREAFNVQRVRNLDKVNEYWRKRWNVLYKETLK